MLNDRRWMRQSCRKMNLESVGSTPELKRWNDFLALRNAAKEQVNIALVGKYVELQDAYKSIDESLLHAPPSTTTLEVELVSVHSEITDENVAELLREMDGVLIAPGFGARGIEGEVCALKYTRTHRIPTLGICLGMQCMVIEFAKKKCVLQACGRSGSRVISKLLRE